MNILLEKNNVNMSEKKLFVSGFKRRFGLRGLEPPTNGL